MPTSICETRGDNHHWNWEESFDKFGFGDGDGIIETGRVEEVLIKSGYDVITDCWGLHNTIITSIKHDDREFIPRDNPEIDFGYDDPRSYLTDAIIKLLDRELS